MDNIEINRILQVMLEYRENVSDLHFYVNRAPQIEVDGSLLSVPIQGLQKLSPFQVDVIAMSIMGADRDALRKFVQIGSTDFSYSIPGVSRFRVNVYRQRGTLSCVMRVIPYGVPTIEELHLPETLYQVAELNNGIVLVTGPTGSGKSTTIASIVEVINKKHPYHIVTIEDPIEYLYRHKAASICQRELGADTTSFAVALRAALRQSPKVIVVGEMRDVETAEIALEAAETGHLVLSTLHTIDASKAIDRIIGIFPQSEEHQIRNRFAQTFRYVIAQRLVPKKNGGRIAAVEILKATTRTREYILKGEGENRTLVDAMQDGYLEGMQTFDKDLERLVRTGVVEKDVALRYATNANNLALLLQTAPADEQIDIIWSELVAKDEFTPSDILRVPDAIQQMMEEVDEEEVDQVFQKTLYSLETGDERQRMSVLSILQALVTYLTDYDRWRKVQDSVLTLVDSSFEQETEEEVLFAYLGYYQPLFGTSFHTKSYKMCQKILKSIAKHTTENERLRKHFGMGIDNLGPAFQKEIRAGSEGADPALEFLRLSGEKGADFLLTWLAEEEDRFTRVRILGYMDRMDAQYLSPQVERRLTDYRWYVVRNMVTIMTKIELEQSSTFMQMVVDHEDPRVPREILKKLFQHSSAEDIPVVLKLIYHSDKTVRLQAVNLCGMLGVQNAVPVLMKFAVSPDPQDTDLRAAALGALTKLQVRDIIPIAQKILEKKAGSKLEISERNAAVRVLGEMAPDVSLPLLKKIATGDSNQETREAASLFVK